MKITCQKSDLVSALARAKSVGAAKTPMPLLSTVLIRKVGNGHIKLAATDLEVGYTANVPAKVDGDDLVCVHAGDLFDRVKAMPDGEIKIDATGKACVVTAKGSKRRFERASVPGEEFPSMPAMADGVGFELEAQALGTLLASTWFIVEPDASRAPGNLLLRWEAGKLMAVACNNHRMSVDERVFDSIKTNGQTLIPFRAVGELRKLLDTEGKVSLVSTPVTTFLDFGDFEFSSRRAEVTFPPFESFPAKRLDNAIRLHVGATREAISAVSLAAGRGDVTASIALDVSDGEAVFSAESADRGVARDSVGVEWEGKLTFRVNGQYLNDALVAAGAEYVALSCESEQGLSPIHIEPWEAQVGRKHYGVVMPIMK